jgi:hypothetical protein
VGVRLFLPLNAHVFDVALNAHWCSASKR